VTSLPSKRKIARWSGGEELSQEISAAFLLTLNLLGWHSWTILHDHGRPSSEEGRWLFTLYSLQQKASRLALLRVSRAPSLLLDRWIHPGLSAITTEELELPLWRLVGDACFSLFFF